MNDEIQQAIVRIDVAGGQARGTGTLVTESLVLTALHVVAPKQEDPVPYGTITLTFPSTHTTGASIYRTYYDATGDWVLLECEQPPPGVKPAPLAVLSASGGEFQTYGFPDAQWADGMAQTGEVTNHAGTLGGQPAIQLFSKQAAAGVGAKVKGLSGAPVVVDDAVVGVFRYALMKEEGRAEAGTLYACPISTIIARCPFLSVASAEPRARRRLERRRTRPRVLRASLGRVHGAWMRRPARAAGLAALWYGAVALASVALGINGRFGDAEGFFTQLNWGWLYLFAMPVCAYVVGWLLQVVDGALDSLDHVLSPAEPDADGGPAFTTYLARRLPAPLKRIAFLAAVLAAGVSIWADYYYLLGPLEWFETPNASWSTVGFTVGNASRGVYLLFNFSVFAMQGFLIYGGCYVALSLAYIMSLYNEQESDAEDAVFLFTWDYADPNARCGLHEFDKVYLLFNLALLIGMAFGGASLYVNVAREPCIDRGIAVMVFSFVVAVPVAFAMIISPYWKGFPHSVPRALMNRGYPEPKPWPFGAGALAWLTILTTVAGAALLAYVLLGPSMGTGAFCEAPEWTAAAYSGNQFSMR